MENTTIMDINTVKVDKVQANNEELLIQRAQSGDRAAFAALYNQHYQSIYTYIYYRVSDTSTAEEVTSQVFVRMVEKIQTFKSRGRPFLAWLYTIARNLITDHHRKNKQAVLLPMDIHLPASRPQPEAEIESRLREDCLRLALTSLTEIQRQVIVGKFIEERSNRDMGTLLKKTEGAVKSLQHRALAALRRAIEKEGCYEP